MSSVVITGTGMVTPAGLGAALLRDSLRRGESFVRSHDDEPWSSARVPRHLVTWPEDPRWQSVREYAGRGSELAVTAATQALESAHARSEGLDRERAATIAVARDDWSDQPVLDGALVHAESCRTESQVLFERLEEAFLLRTFRWGIAYGIAALSEFTGPSVGIDSPTFGGLSGLTHALDLIESGEVDTVLLVGVDTRWRNDTASALHRLAGSRLALGEGASALVLERESSARRRGVRVLARIASCAAISAESIDAALAALGAQTDGCDLGWAWASGDTAQDAAEERFWGVRGAASLVTTSRTVGALLSSGALLHACLASEWLAGAALPHAGGEIAPPRAGITDVLALDRFWAPGAGICRLVASEERP